MKDSIPFSVQSKRARLTASPVAALTSPVATLACVRVVTLAASDTCDLLVQHVAIGSSGFLLALNPKQRITADAALEHSYVAQFHMPNVERTAAHHVHVPIDDCEKKSTAAYRNMLYEEVTRIRRSQGDHTYASQSSHRGGQSSNR